MSNTSLSNSNDMILPSPQSWQVLKQQTAELIASGFLPQSIKTPQQAIAIILKGRELGIPPMQALSHIHVINGKLCMSAELMGAQILKLHPKTRINFLSRTNTKCELEVIRDGCKPSTFTFTMEDAQAAGITGNPSWKKYPRAMLHARCVSEMARSLFPDAISGVSYTPEELGATVDESGDIIDVSPSEPVKETAAEPMRIPADDRKDAAERKVAVAEFLKAANGVAKAGGRASTVLGVSQEQLKKFLAEEGNADEILAAADKLSAWEPPL
jgi:hypothetical protein